MNLLSFDQTHTVNANVTLQTPKDFGVTIGKFRPMANWITNIQFEYGSGLPYSSYGTGKVNDQRLPWTSTTDLKLLRRFEIADLDLELFIDVFNIFDRKNVQYIGNIQYYEIEGDPSIVRRESVTGEYVHNPQIYSDGRQVRFGLSVVF